MKLQFKTILFPLLLITALASCESSKKIAYMENIRDTTVQAVVENLEPVIQKNDLLSISINSVNQEAAQVFNAPNNNAIAGTNSSNTNTGYINQAIGYLVNQEGFIQFPLLGNVKAAGLTKKELTANIARNLVDKKLLVDPIVNVRYLNYKVTVLGEVAKPMVINVPNEKMTVLEALGLAGDITIYGRKDNVLLVREVDGKKQVNRVNLNAPSLLNSPYYYLQSNDVVYVEPNRAKISSTSNAKQWLPIVISGLTLLVVAIDRFTKSKN